MAAQRKIQPNEPVFMVTLKDALADVDGLGRKLSTEQQWEHAAKTFSQEHEVLANLQPVNV